MDYVELVKELRESVNPRENRAADAIEEHENPFFESLKRGLEQAINGEVREMTITDNVR